MPSSEKNTIVDAVRYMIEETASELKIEPCDVQYNAFVKTLWAHMSSRGKTQEDFNKRQVAIRKMGGFRNIRDTHYPAKISSEALLINQVARDNRAGARKKAAEEIFLTRFGELVDKLTKSPILIPAKPVYKKTKDIEREQHLILSDTHVGAFHDTREGLSPYGNIEQSRRLAQVVLQAVDYKPQYRKETNLNINLTGDIIQGALHDPRNGLPVAEQSAVAIHLFSQAIAFAAANYPSVTVRCVPGNHDRFKERHHGRATDQKWDSIATIIYYAIKKCLAHLPNVTVIIPRTPYIAYSSFGVNYFGTHGDTMLNVGNPSSSLNTKSIENQVNRLNASLPDSEEYKVVFLGHIHFGSWFRLGNGVTVITNPPLIPSDSYAQSLGIVETVTGQWLFESVAGHPVGDSRYLTVDSNTDKDESLDNIIKPFLDF